MTKRALAEEVLQSIMKSDLYKVDRSGFRLSVTDKAGNHVAVIQFNDLPDQPRCAVWRSGHLFAQCEYIKNQGWSIYPIQRGKIAKHAVTGSDPLQILRWNPATAGVRTMTAGIA